MEGEEILEPYELRFSDVALLSSDEVAISTLDIERFQSVTRTLMENLGPVGPGLIAITGVPNASILRRKLLPLARELALLTPDHRKRVLKEYGLGSDVPLKNLDRLVSSFAMQLKYEEGICNTNSDLSEERDASHNKEQKKYPDPERIGELNDGKFSGLQNIFKEMGFCMIELGLRLARICDRAIGGQELEQSLLESRSAKARLIHYHSTVDNLLLKEATKRKGSTKGRNRKSQYPTENGQTHRCENDARSCGNGSSLWQQWHYDYGIFTVLTSPMFILPCHSQVTGLNGCEQECSSPSGHTYLKIFSPSKNSFLMVKASPESFIVQVGESADVLSKGKLRATLHSVCRPERRVETDLSRETFVVFLQPAWSKTFSLADHPIKHFLKSGRFSGLCTGEACDAEEEKEDVDKLVLEVNKLVPPLSSRLKDGMTFAEFSRETTKQYYGGGGLQSNK